MCVHTHAWKLVCLHVFEAATGEVVGGGCSAIWFCWLGIETPDYLWACGSTTKVILQKQILSPSYFHFLSIIYLSSLPIHGHSFFFLSFPLHKPTTLLYFWTPVPLYSLGPLHFLIRGNWQQLFLQPKGFWNKRFKAFFQCEKLLCVVANKWRVNKRLQSRAVNCSMLFNYNTITFYFTPDSVANVHLEQLQQP